MIGRHPFPSKFIINEEQAGAEKYYSKKFDHEDLLLAFGDHINDYTDLTQYAKNLYNTYSVTLSDTHTLSPFYDMLVGTGGRIDTHDNFLRWRIYSKPDRRALSLGNPNDEDACYGADQITFLIRLDVDWFGPYDVLAPLDNKRCQVVVESEPKFVGGAYEYEVTLLENPENAATFPVEYLKESNYFIKLISLGSDIGSNEKGTLQFGFDYSYIEFETTMTTAQWGFEVDKEAHEKWGNLEIARCNDDGRPVPGSAKITNFLEIEGMAQIDYEKELWLAYGTQTDYRTAKSTGNRITTGPGLFEFLEESNVIPYNPRANGIDRMINEIDAIWFDRIAPGKRKLVLYTGQAGLKLFHDWIEEKYGNTVVVTPHDFVLGEGAPINNANGKEYSYGGQYLFTKYKLPVFGEISVAHWEFLDNTRINTVTYPNSHYPVSSYEFYAFDIGFGEPNVKLLYDSKEENTWIMPGLWSPFGPTTSKNPVYKQPSGDNPKWGYDWFHRCKFGLVMMDPKRALVFKPNITQ